MAKTMVGIIGVTPGTEELIQELTKANDDFSAFVMTLEKQASDFTESHNATRDSIFKRLAVACGQPENIFETHVLAYNVKTKGIAIEPNGSCGTDWGRVIGEVIDATGCGDPNCVMCKRGEQDGD